jgi:cytochrome c oxidase cbb3-type subunit 3
MSEVNRKDELQGDIIHEYDGIEEADNDLPKWWLWIFYVSIVFAVGYWFVYHEYEMVPTQREAYAKKMAERGGGVEMSAAALKKLAKDEQAVGAGRKLYEDNCVTCHAEQGQGKIGPNLTDPYWIHGGGPKDIFTTIRDGVSSAGMPAWSGPLGPEGVKKVSAYVLSIRNTNVEGKEPEGERWTPGGEKQPAGPSKPGDAGVAPGAQPAQAGDAGVAPEPQTPQAGQGEDEQSGSDSKSGSEQGSDSGERVDQAEQESGRQLPG